MLVSFGGAPTWRFHTELYNRVVTRYIFSQLIPFFSLMSRNASNNENDESDGFDEISPAVKISENDLKG